MRNTIVYSASYIDKPLGTLIGFPYGENKGSFVYETSRAYTLTPVSVPQIISEILRLESFEFKVNDAHYVLYPMDKIVQVNGGSSKCLGRFSKFIVNGGAVHLVYTDGDTCVGSSRYSSVVWLIPSATTYAKKHYSNNTGGYSFKLYMSRLMETAEEVQLGIHMPMEDEPKAGERAVQPPNSEQLNVIDASVSKERQSQESIITALNKVLDINGRTQPIASYANEFMENEPETEALESMPEEILNEIL